MSTTRHTLTKWGTGHPSAPLSVPVLLERQAKIMTKAGRAKQFHIRFGRADMYGRARTFKEVQDRTKALMGEKHPNGELYTLGVDPGVDIHILPLVKVHRVEIGYPVADTPGVHSIDVIVGALYAEFGKAPGGLTNLGICANKPGEHGVCNAFDGGVSGPTADEIHARLLIRANWLRNKMLLDMQGEAGGLPVNGIIVMEQVCSRDNPDWHYYSGTPHVSHFHVSGWPNLIPGWI